MMESRALRDLILDLGAGDVGFADLRGCFAREPVTSSGSPDLPYAVSIVVPLLHAVMDEVEAGPTYSYYTHYRAVNRLIDDISLRVAMRIEQQGYYALPIPASQTVDQSTLSGRFSHKLAATRSGLGWIGKSALFVSDRFGPRVRLGTVLTSMPLQVGDPVTESRCGECTICMDACPAGAVTGQQWTPGIPRERLLDAYRCSAHMRKAYNHIGRGAVCGICVSRCPVGKAARRQSAER